MTVCCLCATALATTVKSEQSFCQQDLLQLQVTSGGPILGVSIKSTSGSPAFAMMSLAALVGAAVVALGMFVY